LRRLGILAVASSTNVKTCRNQQKVLYIFAGSADYPKAANNDV
jgi:hypothetical protein